MMTVRLAIPQGRCSAFRDGPDMQEAPREAILIGLVAAPIFAVLVAALVIEKIWERFVGGQ